jgi:hypothetical protein
MKNFVHYTSRKCFASARVAPSRLGALATQYHSHSQNIIFWTSNPNNYMLYFLKCPLIFLLSNGQNIFERVLLEDSRIKGIAVAMPEIIRISFYSAPI